MAPYSLRSRFTLSLLVVTFLVFCWRKITNPPRSRNSLTVSTNRHRVKVTLPIRESASARREAIRIFPHKAGEPEWRLKNQNTLTRLIQCQRQPGLAPCSPKDKHIVLLGTVHFQRVVDGMFKTRAQFPAGEAIWADALLWALDQLKYPYLVVDGIGHNHTNYRVGQVYELIGEDVSMVLGDYLSVPQCLKNPFCFQTESYPNGVPSHKLFVFDGWGQDVGHPLGRQWHLTFYPQEKVGFTYLGLTLEHYCHKFGVIPASERFNKIYVLGKDRAYLHKPAPTLYRPSVFSDIANATGVSFTIGTVQKSWSKLHGDSRDELLPGLDDIGSLSRDSFIYQVQRHRAVIGLGWPMQPSTPLEALCVGTPFINPVWLGRRSIADRSKWHTQHPYLAQFDPPYVYNVQDHREDDILEAVQTVMKNPLTEAFIPDDMKKEAYLARIESLVTKNWSELSRSKPKLKPSPSPQ